MKEKARSPADRAKRCSKMKKVMRIPLTIYRIQTAVYTNLGIYYIKKLPLIGKQIPDRIYGDSDLKLTASVIMLLLNIIRKFLGKFMILGLMIFLPLFFISEKLESTTLPEAFVHLFFFLYFIGGTVQISALMEPGKIKYICVRLMRFRARDYEISAVLTRHLSNFIYYFPSVFFPYLMMGGNGRKAVLLLLLLTAFRFISEGLQLLLFQKTGILFPKKFAVQWLVIIPALAAAYLPFYLKTIWPIESILFSLPFILIVFTGTFASIRYMIRFRDYKKVVIASVKSDDMMLDMNKIKSEAMFSNVRVKESDFSEAVLSSGKFEDKKGYEYLNAIFFERHKKLLVTPIIRWLFIIGVVFAASTAAAFLFPGMVGVLDQSLSGLLPSFVFVMYFTSIGDRVCRAMFYNCDISLLRYGFYRDRDVILKNFMVRLKKITGLNLITGAAISIGLLAFILITGISFHISDFALFVVSILCLSVFFSVHHLFLYYVLQPYTTELNIKNPYFRVINTIVYLLCFGCLQLRKVPGFFTIAVIAATLLYILTALILVYRFAPANFRVK